MKFICIALMVIMTIVNPLSAQNDENKEELLRNFFEVVADCQKQYPRVPAALVRLALRHEMVPLTRNQKCLSSCILVNSGLVKDSKIVVEAWKEISYAKWSNKKDAAGATQSAAICAKIVPEIKDECEMAGISLDCIIVANRVLRVPPPDVPE